MDPEPPSLQALIATIDISIVSGFVLLFVLLCCSALISGAEVALFSLTRTDIDSHPESENKRFKIILQLLERPKNYWLQF
ncbi:hemolysins and related proteins containing CBS domains [Jejuia pallidilutea]|uniref:Hemolysins and related proteins containing CBS domains n=1 Tax=Jejuia pallidilutea TaxID=504487 RepID=A0A090WQB0_9FLAO|nr:hemolysins and related proteins containing CBS domains [Jejuia pallidilutea]